MRFFRLVSVVALPVIGSCANGQEGFSLSDDPVSVALTGANTGENADSVEVVEAGTAESEDTGEPIDTGDECGPPGHTRPPPRHDDSGTTTPPPHDSGLHDSGGPDHDSGGPDRDSGVADDTGTPVDDDPPADTSDSIDSDSGVPTDDTAPHDETGATATDSGEPVGDSAPNDPIEDSVSTETGTPGADADSASPDSADTASAGPSGEVCDGIDNDLDGEIDEDATDAILWYTDLDGDGIGSDLAGLACEPPNEGDVATGGDCDDTNTKTHPGALEICDGIDNNCDLMVDNDAIDATTWYADNDGDGYGDGTNTFADCVAPEGYVDVALDCDDASATISPEGVETCNTLDDDCSGSPDDNGGDCTPVEEDPPSGGTDTGSADTGGDTGEIPPETEDCTGVWYEDLDGDGYGSPYSTAVGCSPGPGWLRNNDDCDDTTFSISPASFEICDGTDNDCDGEIDESDALDAPPRYYDGDGDGYGRGDTVVHTCDIPTGYSTIAGDCNDGNSAISPGAVEYCDGVDNDCGEGADEVSAVDAPLWFMDVDGDGFAGELTRSACSQPVDSYPTSEDCDDGDELVFPGGLELCNDIDDDCNGVVDDATSTGAGFWYADADNDGYGDVGTATWSCSSIDGFVENGEDCDDANSGAAPHHRELCDSYDNDCDGLTDESGASGELVWYADNDADGYGDLASTAEACDLPAGYSASWGDCDDASSAVSPAMIEVCGDWIDNDCDGVSEACGPWGDRDVGVADASFWGEGSTDDAGRSVSFVPDTDGDGLDDIVVGAGHADPGVTEGGATYIFRGPFHGGQSLGSAQAKIHGESGADLSGFAVDGTEDADGDGLGDVLIGAYKDGLGGIESGSVYLVGGAFDGEMALDSARLILTGATAADWGGYSLAALGDATGDGSPDVLVGAPYEDHGGSKAGAAYVVSLTHTGTRSLSTAEATMYGEVSLDRAGTAVGAPGDVDGDGIADILVGAWGDSTAGSRAGAAYLVYGPASGTISLRDADAKRTGEAANNRAGWSVGGGGDIDGDGLVDALIGAPYASKAYAMGGMVSGVASLSTSAITFVASEVSVHAGSSVASGGDFDGDGGVDVLIGAPGDDTHGTESGAVFVVAGPVSGNVDLDAADGLLTGTNSRDAAGTGVCGDGDVDGDGMSDVLIGAPGSDLGGSETGAAYLFFGAER